MAEATLTIELKNRSTWKLSVLTAVIKALNLFQSKKPKNKTSMVINIYMEIL